MKRDWESEFAQIAYLALITGEGTKSPQPQQRGWRGEMSTGPRDWEMTWDMELSVWDFRRRSIVERLGGSPPPATGYPAASPGGPGA